MTCILDAFTSKSPLAPHKKEIFPCAADARMKKPFTFCGGLFKCDTFIPVGLAMNS